MREKRIKIEKENRKTETERTLEVCIAEEPFHELSTHVFAVGFILKYRSIPWVLRIVCRHSNTEWFRQINKQVDTNIYIHTHTILGRMTNALPQIRIWMHQTCSDNNDFFFHFTVFRHIFFNMTVLNVHGNILFNARHRYLTIYGNHTKFRSRIFWFHVQMIFSLHQIHLTKHSNDTKSSSISTLSCIPMYECVLWLRLFNHTIKINVWSINIPLRYLFNSICLNKHGGHYHFSWQNVYSFHTHHWVYICVAI